MNLRKSKERHHLRKIPPKAGQESVWDFPRPAVAEAISCRIRVRLFGQTLIDTQDVVRVIETSHPPVYYLPIAGIQNFQLQENPSRSWCEWKGQAGYFDIAHGDSVIVNAGWFYPQPSQSFALLKQRIALYPSKMEACHVDDFEVQAQEGDFYGGWITPNIVGPFKGGPGTRGW